MSTGRPPLELWGGIECTVARIGDSYRDQSLDTGHRERLGDLDRIAALGIRTLRYPLIWETIAPNCDAEPDWTWHDGRLARMRELGIRPIATLCHHGSGPRHTNLLDPAFAEGLAEHAARVAERYPWIDLYTPVNEPLTTARFSALYGHWYPHARDYGAFLRALVNQCRATVLAMRAIRAVRSDAALVQTDDLGKTFSTPLLAYQAEHDNERRWLTFDLLCGRVGPDHPLWGFFVDWAKLEPAELAVFAPADAAPDIIGINHYLTSDRFLDEDYRQYPEHHWGGNGRHRYADAEAVRMHLPDSEVGPAARLREVWERYRRPIAVTEVHHGCTRDEQLRWLKDVWDAAQQVREKGGDVRAVTVWAMFGTVDWNTLLTEPNGIYEPGIFDVRGPAPRLTILGKASAALATAGELDHPVLDRPGWWRREARFYAHVTGPAARGPLGAPRRLLIAGAAGTLGRAFSRVCDTRGLDHVLTSRADLDIADPESVEAALRRHEPWAVINTAGHVRVAPAEGESDLCLRKNAEGAENLARACTARGIPLVVFSSDLVFDGARGPYIESDQVNPACVYGRAEAEAERRVIAAHAGALVIRTSPFFGPWDDQNFGFAVLRALAAAGGVEASGDVVSPTYVPDLAHVALDLLIDGEAGIWHLASPGAISWRDFARRVAREAGLDPEMVSGPDTPRRNTALASERGLLLPPLDTAFERFLRDCELDWSGRAVPAIAAE
jgi:dTDP-4-dehydrorhamnose reductase